MKFFSFFRKESNKNSDNNNNNNQASNQPPLKLEYQTETTGEQDSLNSLIKQFNIDKKQLSSYDDYYNLQNEIITRKNDDQREFYQNELDYLYNLKTKKDPKTEKNNIEKMKAVGKIYTSNSTFFDINDVGRNNAKISFNNLKIESLNYFLSIMANNCVISGKWCYEVTLLTNGLMQIGFCQLNSHFTRHSGVGDDKTSYAYDGHRKLSWNADRKMYGKFWDCGDVVGVCIDLDKKIIEYFLNGTSLGTAFYNILKGENIAYFPAISMHRGEACIFNFGQMPFKHEYKGYQSFDTPISKINKVDVIISDLLKIWVKNILPLLASSKISEYQILLLSSDIFYLISQYNNDLYVFQNSILPFLIELTDSSTSSDNKNYSFNKFILSILETTNDNEAQKNIGYQLYEYISIEILENALRMGNFIEKEEEINQKLTYYENLMKVFISFLKCDKITSFLMEKGTLEIFKNVFNSNWFNCGDLLEHLCNNHTNILKSNLSVKSAIKELKKQILNSKEKYFDKINEVISKQLSNILYIFLTDQRKLFNGKILKDELNDLIRRGYSMIDNNEVMLNILGLGNKLSKQEPIFLRNIFMNLIYTFDENFLNINFDEMSTHPWFYRSEPNTIYFDEVGIGGTISHVTTEYASKVPDNLIIKSEKFGQDFFHKLIHICNDLFINGALKKFEEFYNKSGITSISEFVKVGQNTTIKFNLTVRNFFYVYPGVIQVALYKMAFFIIKYLMYLIKKNDYIIYFFPISVTEIPFAFFKILINLKSPLFFDEEHRLNRLNINKCSKHFEKDDFIQNIVEFYLILFSDEKIANPELKESFLKKVNFLLEKKILEEFYEEDAQIFERLIKGLLKDLKGDSLSHNASKILLKIISPICFGYKVSSKHRKKEKNKYLFNTKKIVDKDKINKEKKEKKINNEIYLFKQNSSTEKLKKYFEGNFQIFDEFLKSYGSILNKVMTNYSMSLSSIMEIGVNNLDINNTELNRHLLANHIEPQSDRALFQGLSSSYNEMCQLLKIYEFLILIYPDEFLDTKKLNYINFINVLKNISTRVLKSPYIDQILQLIKTINPKISSKIISEKNKIEIYQIGLSIAGIFIQIQKWDKKNKFYDSFCKETANIPELNLESFNDFIKYVLDELKNLESKEKPDDIIKEIETNYIMMIKYLLSLRDVKELTNEEMDELISQDKLCLLCYENPSNTELIPCKHRCCNTCYNQYKIDKNICFICQQAIESINIINPK